MIHSFLIVGGTKKKREEASKEKRPKEKSEALTEKSLALGNSGAGAPTSKFDTTILEPEEDKQAISIDQIRDLQHQLSLKPYAAKFKTGIILEAQRMTVEAQNALLKTLEEPPAHSVLILTTPSTKNLLPTIVSRCQIVRLQAEIDLDFESAKHQQQAEEFLKLLQQGRGERLAWVEENKSTISNLPAGKAGQQSTIGTLDVWISVLRDLLLTNSGCQSLTLNPVTIQPFNHLTIDTSDLARSFNLTVGTKRLISSTNVSPRLALEVLLLDLPVLQPPQP